MGYPLTLALIGIISVIWTANARWCSGPGSECQLSNQNTSLLCRGNVLDEYFDSVNADLHVLHLCRLSSFHPDMITIFPYLMNLSVVHSKISKISEPFPSHRYLQVLNLSSLELHYLDNNVFTNLLALKILDLSYNKFNHLEEKLFPPSVLHIYIKGDTFNCSSDMKWIVENKKLADSKHMYCGGMKYFTKPVAAIMRFMNTLERECPRVDTRQCQCSLDNVVWSQTADFLIPLTTVNCSHLHLEKLPASIPSNTTVLLLKNNKISDLSPIVTNLRYHRIADIYLDNNVVENVDILEGAAWLNNFRVLSIKSNKIKVLPTYAFDNAFEKNSHAVKVYFGNNPWTCDCAFTPGFKDLLAKHHSLIQDADDIKCSYIRNDDNSLIRIKELTYNAICREAGDFWLSALDFLNVILALLIILVTGKFLYDYWTYKTTGKLPWIAMKLL